MPRGIKLPFQVSKSGGIATISGDENDSQIIKVALSDGDNLNAYMQNATLGIDMIFDINEETSRARVLNRIERIFENFKVQKRFSLLKNTITWDESRVDKGEIILSFRYINLESDDEKTFEQKFNTN